MKQPDHEEFPSKDTLSDKVRRQAYLNSKGISPNSPHQLDLLFPDTIGSHDGLRHIPNDYARSSLFTTRRNVPRENLIRKKLFNHNTNTTILYTGSELRAEDDELVWLQIVKYCENVPLGEPVEFSIKDLVLDIGWHKNGRYYTKAEESISRLKATEILALNDKAYGKSGALSLIQKYTTVNDEKGSQSRYRVWLDPNLIVLFAGNTFTSHLWDVYRSLSPTARRLVDYIESHKHPFPLSLDSFQELCASSSSKKYEWRRHVKKICEEIQLAGIVNVAIVDEKDQICCVRNTRPDNGNHAQSGAQAAQGGTMPAQAPKTKPG
jgi:hypothetical protein